MDNPRVICIESTAFFALIDEVVTHLEDKFSLSKEYLWIDSETAMKLLNIKSRTTLQTLRDTGKIRFSQPTRKGILYDRQSILDYLEQNAQTTF